MQLAQGFVKSAPDGNFFVCTHTKCARLFCTVVRVIWSVRIMHVRNLEWVSPQSGMAVDVLLE